MQIAVTRTPLGHLERALVGLEIFLALGAFGGALGLLTGGIDLGDSVADLPFESAAFGGVALAVINGLLPTAVVAGALLRRSWAHAGHVVVGSALVGWIGVQVVFIGLGSWIQVAYFAYGLVILLLGVMVFRRPADGTSQPVA
jgi:hypothetical protein